MPLDVRQQNDTYRMTMKAWAVYLNDPQPYARMTTVQERLVAARTAEDIPDTVLFLQHQPVVTLGRRGRDNFLRATPAELKQQGVELAHASRGGDVTYHAPGQIVMYPILHLGSAEADSHGYLFNLEEVAIRTAAEFGVDAFRREGKNGAWTDAGKIAAIGFRLKRWVSCHGMSFNVNIDLKGFETIVPCGLVGEPVASLASILGDACPDLGDVRTAMTSHFEQVCGRELNVFEESSAPEVLQKLFSGSS